MQTNFNAAGAVWSGQLDLVVSGGVEMMSRVPMGSNNGSMSDAVLDRFDVVMQGISAEEIADKWNLSREELDRYSYESHMRAARAIDEGRFEKEIVPVELDVPAPDSRAAARRRWCGRASPSTRRCGAETTMEKLAALQPAFVPDGQDHRGQLEPDRRRGGRRADRVGEEGVRARAAPARTLPRLRHRRRRPAPDAARQPGGVREGAREGGAQLGRHRGDRGERGVRVGRAPVPRRHRASASAGRPAT